MMLLICMLVVGVIFAIHPSISTALVLGFVVGLFMSTLEVE